MSGQRKRGVKPLGLEKAERVNISVTPTIRKQLERLARGKGLSVSRWITEQVSENMSKLLKSAQYEIQIVRKLPKVAKNEG